MEPTLAQYKATARFHQAAANAYRKAGDMVNAEKAQTAADNLTAKANLLERADAYDDAGEYGKARNTREAVKFVGAS